MRIAHDAVGVACLIPRAVHSVLLARAARVGQSVPQLVAALIERGLDVEGRILVPQSVAAAASAERDAAEAEVEQLRGAIERSNDDIAALRRRLAAMEAVDACRLQEISHLTQRADGLIPPGTPPGRSAGPRDMVDRGRDEAPASDADALTPAFIKSCIGFRAAGNSPAEIARLMRCPLDQVRRALNLTTSRNG